MLLRVCLVSALALSALADDPPAVNCDATKGCLQKFYLAVGANADTTGNPKPDFNQYPDIGDVTKLCPAEKTLRDCVKDQPPQCLNQANFQTMFALSDVNALRYASQINLEAAMCVNYSNDFTTKCLVPDGDAKTKCAQPITGLKKVSDATCNVAATALQCLQKIQPTDGCSATQKKATCQVMLDSFNAQTYGVCSSKLVCNSGSVLSLSVAFLLSIVGLFL